jgi:acetate kinase
VKILVLNPGSSSLKRAVYVMPEETRLEDDGGAVDAVGIRVVHGGSRFVTPVRIDQDVLDEIRALAELAPLHNPRAVQIIEETQAARPGIPVVAVFDTAFHRTLPPLSFTYAIPEDLGVRRYGFHGISYSYVSSRVRAARQIICHLGNGASVCAVRDGESVETSMGFTPMEGLVMGSRSGDLDPGVILYLLRKGMSEDELDDALNKRSGLVALSGESGDVRELEAAAAAGDERAEFALELFAYRAARYIGAYAAVLEGVDAVIFTAGIGEHSPSMRTRICRRLKFLGITLNEERNRDSSTVDRLISSGAVEVWVIPTNEELEIARLTSATLNDLQRSTLIAQRSSKG